MGNTAGGVFADNLAVLSVYLLFDKGAFAGNRAFARSAAILSGSDHAFTVIGCALTVLFTDVRGCTLGVGCDHAHPVFEGAFSVCFTPIGGGAIGAASSGAPTVHQSALPAFLAFIGLFAILRVALHARFLSSDACTLCFTRVGGRAAGMAFSHASFAARYTKAFVSTDIRLSAVEFAGHALSGLVQAKPRLLAGGLLGTFAVLLFEERCVLFALGDDVRRGAHWGLCFLVALKVGQAVVIF